MAANKKLLMLAGDGIGPEVMGEVRRVIDWMDRRRHVSFDVEEALVGGAAIDAGSTPESVRGTFAGVTSGMARVRGGVDTSITFTQEERAAAAAAAPTGRGR